MGNSCSGQVAGLTAAQRSGQSFCRQLHCFVPSKLAQVLCVADPSASSAYASWQLRHLFMRELATILAHCMHVDRSERAIFGGNLELSGGNLLRRLRDKFQAVTCERIEFRDHGLRDNVALLSILRPRCSAWGQAAAAPTLNGSATPLVHGSTTPAVNGAASSEMPGGVQCSSTPGAGSSVHAGDAAAQLVVANTHILFNPARGDVKVILHFECRVFCASWYVLQAHISSEAVPGVARGPCNGTPTLIHQIHAQVQAYFSGTACVHSARHG